MTVKEHLQFYAMFNGLSYSDASKQAMDLIQRVDLMNDYKKMTTSLSGGMKRRCSLAIALTGNPKIIFLDEPSSGLDPVKRRHFWQLIKNVTKDMAVMLTTHLMEEADTLCNEIGIITTGQLRCFGSSISLKQQLCSGLKLQVVVNKTKKSTRRLAEDVDRVTAALNESFTELKVLDVFEGTINYEISDKKAKLSQLFARIRDVKSQLEIEDWSISLGSLEDVFLKIVKTHRGVNVVKKIAA